MCSRFFLSDFDFKAQGIIIDTNVLIFYYGTKATDPGSKYIGNRYFAFLMTCKDKGIKLVISQLSLGEYYHVQLSEELGKENAKRTRANLSKLDPKAFRLVARFKIAQQNIISEMNSMISFVDEIIGVPFRTVPEVKLGLQELIRNPIDFSDHILENSALDFDYWILSDDSDFLNSNAKLVSFNRQLCPSKD